ncbi:MAG: hypothetical protein CMJ89_13265 [Planctomycetes bacterium]|nr:hypothetical protein [Planctomycetota bacterium]
MKASLFDRQGVPIKIGKEIARGGEGAILEIQGHPKYVAKVYHKPVFEAKAAKLNAMVDTKTARLVELAAWPVEVIQDGDGHVVGVVLPKILDYKDIHLLYGPRSRMREFPTATWPFLIRTAANLARAFSAIHEAGHVIGDVNDKVALVSEKSIVKLIDCDSFQVNADKKLYPCDVGVLTHQPPEFQGVKTFRGLRRTKNHDNFGLSVLIFQLLFMARHPFSGSYEGPEDMPIEKAIKEYRYVYGPDAANKKMKPPPHAIMPTALPPEMRELFERAFAEGSDKKMRPAAKEWVVALEELFSAVTKCKTNPSHSFILRNGPCPFCALESTTCSALFNLPVLFQTKEGRQRTALINIGTIWKEIRTVKPPGKLAPFQQMTEGKALPKPASKFIYYVSSLAIIITAIGLAHSTDNASLALLGVIPPLWLFSRGNSSRAGRSRKRFTQVELRWKALVSPREFLKYHAKLVEAKKALNNLGDEHERKMKDVHSSKHQDQLDCWLDKHKIAPGEIKGISSAALAILQSYGIETAKDLKRKSLAEVPTIGSARVKALMAWRLQLEKKFMFDPGKGVDPMAIASVGREIDMKRAELVQLLAEGPAKLKHIARQTHLRRVALKTEFDTICDTAVAA